MRSARLLLLLGVGALLLGAPCGGAVGAPRQVSVSAEAEALALLVAAAHAVQERGWSGTQYVSSWDGGAVSSAVLDVHHPAGRATEARATPTTADAPGRAAVLPTGAADEQLLALLGGHYDLAVSGSSTCAGRPVHVVEARRGDGQVAGRFWLDRASGLALRREVYDGAGRLLRSSAYVDLDVTPRTVRVARTAPAARLAAVEHAAPPFDGAPLELPGGFTRFDERAPRDGLVTQLAYSDGLSTVSVFRQPGSLGTEHRDGYLPQRVGEGTVWVHAGAPEQVVWSGGGAVYTAVSDAGPEATLLAIGALPLDADPDDGVGARLGRGLARVGSWVDPFG